MWFFMTCSLSLIFKLHCFIYLCGGGSTPTLVWHQASHRLLRRSDEQHPAAIAERGAEHHLSPVVVMRSGVRNKRGGLEGHEHIHHQMGSRTYAWDHGTGPSHQAERAVRPYVQPGVRDLVCVVVGVQGRIKDEFSRVVQVELPAHDIAGGHEGSSPWHRIARARHRNGLSSR